MKLTLITLMVIFCGIACEYNPEPETPDMTQEEALPANLFALEKWSNAITVTEARKLEAGTEVTVTGQIIGSKTPFVSGRASFIVGDNNKIAACTDDCAVPWDACCDDKNLIAAATLSIQVLNENGQIVKADLKGKNNLAELSSVTVKGKIDTRSTNDFMIINAEQIYVE